MDESQLNALHDKIDDGFRSVDKQLRALDARAARIEDMVEEIADRLLAPSEVTEIGSRTQRPTVADDSQRSPSP